MNNKILMVLGVATVIEYFVSKAVAPMLGYPNEVVILPLILIGNVATAVAAHYIYTRSK